MPRTFKMSLQLCNENNVSNFKKLFYSCISMFITHINIQSLYQVKKIATF